MSLFKNNALRVVKSISLAPAEGSSHSSSSSPVGAPMKILLYCASEALQDEIRESLPRLAPVDEVSSAAGEISAAAAAVDRSRTDLLVLGGFDWLNTYQGLIVPHIASGFGVFLLRQHFKSFPADFTDADRIDGATSWRVLWKVIVPSNLTAIWSLAVLFFIDAWNQYLWPLLVATDRPMQTLPIGIQIFINPEGGTQWGPIMAAATLAIVPSILLYVFAQRHILESAVSIGMRGWRLAYPMDAVRFGNEDARIRCARTGGIGFP